MVATLFWAAAAVQCSKTAILQLQGSWWQPNGQGKKQTECYSNIQITLKLFYLHNLHLFRVWLGGWMWRSEDNVSESVLFSTVWIPGIKLRSSGTLDQLSHPMPHLLQYFQQQLQSWELTHCAESPFLKSTIQWIVVYSQNDASIKLPLFV